MNRQTKIVKDTKNLLDYNDGECVLTSVYLTITKAVISNCEFIEWVFGSRLGYYFEEWTKYVFNTFPKHVKCVCAV